MVVSPYCTIGPFFPASFVGGHDDLTHFRGGTARGQHIVLSGRVLQEGGVPTRNTILEIWQPDANGIFSSCPDADPGFSGWGRARTDAEGWYRIRTVVPGSYGDRCPHANLMILAIGLTHRLVTTVFFADDPDTVRDPVLDCVADVAARRRLFARRENAGEYRFDLILRGENETPFFLD
ncbi:MAG: protocatechuate 3,4-dioxygenase subunit beta [Acidobacteriia bacterium]|nr:protocatechuate 3,4-dioxygenase subunit beta [Terriglobia bacterium]